MTQCEYYGHLYDDDDDQVVECLQCGRRQFVERRVDDLDSAARRLVACLDRQQASLYRDTIEALESLREVLA